MIWGRFRTAGGRAFLFPTIALVLVGCGISEYDERAERQRKRVLVFDDEVKYLADPIAPPSVPLVKGKANNPAWPFELYLRAPIFIKPKRPAASVPKKGEKPNPAADPETEFTFTNQNLKLSYYAGDDRNFGMLVGAAKLLEKNPPGRAVPNEMTAAEFKGRLPGAIAAYYFQKLRAGQKASIQFPPVFVGEVEKLKPVSSAGEGPAMFFEKAIYHEEPTKDLKDTSLGFAAYYWGDAKLGRQVAIIYQVPAEMIAEKTQFPRTSRAGKYSASLVTEAIKFSLKSLATGEDANKKKKDFAAKKY